MALTFAQARTICQARIADSSNSTAVDQAIDQAQREVCRAKRWPELMGRAFFLTSAAYSTGTVAVANGATTWTLTGGTFPTDAATLLYRLSLGLSSPWYEVVTRTDGTHIETAAFQGSTVTASGFLIYKSHYSLPSTVDRVEQLWLHDSGEARELENAVTDSHVTDFTHYPSGPGVPTHFMSIERDASGNRQILLGPETPDAVYRVEYTYKRKPTAGTLALDDTRWPIILARACAILYEPEFYDRHLQAQAEYERLLKKEWADELETETQGFVLGEGRVNRPDWGFDGLIGRGTVPEPTT